MQNLTDDVIGAEEPVAVAEAARDHSPELISVAHDTHVCSLLSLCSTLNTNHRRNAVLAAAQVSTNEVMCVGLAEKEDASALGFEFCAKARYVFQHVLIFCFSRGVVRPQQYCSWKLSSLALANAGDVFQCAGHKLNHACAIMRLIVIKNTNRQAPAKRPHTMHFCTRTSKVTPTGQRSHRLVSGKTKF